MKAGTLIFELRKTMYLSIIIASPIIEQRRMGHIINPPLRKIENKFISYL